MKLDNQASRLAPFGQGQTVKTIAVTAGKGGVGKTNVAANLAIALAARQRVLLLDADLGLANLDVLLGLHARHSLMDVLSGQSTLENSRIKGPNGIDLIPGASGVTAMTALDRHAQSQLIQAFNHLSASYDTLLIDTGAGIHQDVMLFAQASDHVVIVLCDEPSALTDAYALIKILNKEYGVNRFQILANMIQPQQEGSEVFQKLNRVTAQFLEVTLEWIGFIPFDDCLKQAVRKQQSVVLAYPYSPSALAFKKIAQAIEDWPVCPIITGTTQFFMNRLFESGHQAVLIRGCA